MSALTTYANHLSTPQPHAIGTVSLYHAFLNGSQSSLGCDAAAFLRTQLIAAKNLPCNLPYDPAHIATWSAEHVAAVAVQYSEYLAMRRSGGTRRFFSNKAHALYFLQRVAPSKLVDGVWLYSTVKHAGDFRYHGLIRTYLEELGDGDPALNHVTLYRKLLAENDCAPTHYLDDGLYLQGALQLALGQVGDDFLPELIGYNLGYEQLPLHLLITSFELNELGIDPYYFSLHVTIDNVSSGHAQKAVEAVTQFLAVSSDREGFLKRVRAGYRLNDLGLGSTAVIESFNLEAEVVEMLERKRTFGQHMHSDYCRLEGRTINEWLEKPGQIRAFLKLLEDKGWIKRHQDPELSRFWQLISGAGAAMFGVFSGYEQQVLRDWIAGEWCPAATAQNVNPFRARFRNRSVGARPDCALLASRNESIEELVGQISPACHPTPEGLRATRIFSHKLSVGGFN